MCRFLPAPSARRATSTSRRRKPERRHFYPRPPRGGRPDTTDKSKQRMEFLSTPSARRATPDPAGAVVSDQFLSTPSARRATDGLRSNLQTQLISIHALREEGDRGGTSYLRVLCNFYPRPPRGGRPLSSRPYRSATKFLSTPSARRATLILSALPISNKISIHALREEGDINFQLPRIPRSISIHALREEGDPLCLLH